MYERPIAYISVSILFLEMHTPLGFPEEPDVNKTRNVSSGSRLFPFFDDETAATYEPPFLTKFFTFSASLSFCMVRDCKGLLAWCLLACMLVKACLHDACLLRNGHLF